METQIAPLTNPPYNRYRLYQEAKKIIEHRIVFFIHFGIYLAVIALLFLMNIISAPHTGFWFLWPAIFWGAGILVHGCFVLLYSHKNMLRWHEKIHGRRALEMLLGFSMHLSLYVIFNLLLITLNVLEYRRSPQTGFWSLWIVLGWGIGMAFHFLWVYLNKDHKLKRWKRRKALQILDSWGDLP